jgi:hypothetical protein
MEYPIKIYLCLRVPRPSDERRHFDMVKKSVRSPRVLDALKDNNYSVSLPKLYKDVCVLLKTRRFAGTHVFLDEQTRISSSTQQVL